MSLKSSLLALLLASTSPASQLPESPVRQECAHLDIKFLLDVSMSMSTAIPKTKQTIHDFGSHASRSLPDPHLGLGIYGMVTQRYRNVLSLTGNLPSLDQALQDLTYQAGSEEYAGNALFVASREPAWRADAYHFVVFITDEIAEEKENFAFAAVSTELPFFVVVPPHASDRLNVVRYWERQGALAVVPAVSSLTQGITDYLQKQCHDPPRYSQLETKRF